MKKYIALILTSFLVAGFAIADEQTTTQEKSVTVINDQAKADTSPKALTKENKKHREGKMQHSKKHYGKKHYGKKHFDVEAHSKALTEHLDLTEEQINRIKEIRGSFEAKHPKPDFKAMTKDERGAWFEENKASLGNLKKEISTVLTPEQRDKAKAYYQDKIKEMRTHKKKHTAEE